ncbi:hypothetical protein CAEBREN_11527 [Caenorhabditis brenneri]|uniref:DUF7809 domain-containing protein n=1 Tax=Caenorhabditis brenneri TaxID=135651 RepID=G0NHW5_CAEBE|nr:hypothetical protein CAEBREN_11527 [Caenorhabditis brenneri]
MLWDLESIERFLWETPGYTSKYSFPVLLHYIEEEDLSLFTKKNAGSEYNYDNSKRALYASCDETQSCDLVRLGNFPGALQIFGYRFYRIKGQTWRSNQQRTYCYKQELFSILIQQLEFPEKKNRDPKAENMIAAIYSLCDIYLKHKEKTLLYGICELVKIDLEKFRGFRDKLWLIYRRKINDEGKLAIDVFETRIKRQFDSLCPGHDVSELNNFMIKFKNEKSFEEHPFGYFFIAQVFLTFTTECEKFIDSNESWFTISTDGRERPCIVRKFIYSEKEAIFLASEILEVIRRRGLDGGDFQHELENMVTEDELATIDLDQVEHKWEHNIGGVNFSEVEYIEYYVMRTDRRAIYIPYGKKNHCILAYSAFMELLRWLISSKKLFWKTKNDDWRVLIEMIISKFPKFRKIDAEATQFMSLEEVERVREFANEKFSEMYGDPESKSSHDEPLEDIFIQFEARGSIPEGLEAELIGLNSCMSDILDMKEQLVRIIRTRRPDLKPEQQLSLFDSYQATETAQLIYILRKMYNCYEWMENQGFGFDEEVTAVIRQDVEPQEEPQEDANEPQEEPQEDANEPQEKPQEFAN